MYNVCLFLFFVVSVLFISLIMIQQNKNFNMGTSFNININDRLINSSNSNDIITRTIGILVSIFFILSLVLNNINSKKLSKNNKWENLSVPKNVKINQNKIKKHNEHIVHEIPE
ncbi:MAG: preprotein translocase subunit SecG [Pantoea sp. Brub]|nr:preprotein translocase subunit SecG [Pantoea sp. Brub]